MTTADSTAVHPQTHPRSRSMESWRATLGVLASRGEVVSPRVTEARAALAWHRHRAFLLREGSSPEQADELMDLIDAHQAEAAAEVTSA